MELKRKSWTFMHHEPYTRKDGSETDLKVWRGACRVCGTPIFCKTNWEKSHAFESKNCYMHRLLREARK